MPVTRTQQKLSDKEIDFDRKDENDSKVTIIKKWGDPDRFLDQYFNNREKWDNHPAKGWSPVEPSWANSTDVQIPTIVPDIES